MLSKTAIRATPTAPFRSRRRNEILLREALGEALRSFRMERHMTLRELAELACTSPGYISELERGRKEVSSELLASVCHALGTSVADVLIEAAGSMALSDVAEELATAEASAPGIPAAVEAPPRHPSMYRTGRLTKEPVAARS